MRDEEATGPLTPASVPTGVPSKSQISWGGMAPGRPGRQRCKELLGQGSNMRGAVVAAAAILSAACASEPVVSSPSPSALPTVASGLRLVAVGSMATPRAVQTSTRLADGRVLVAGGCTDAGCNLGSPGGATAEIFDPRTRAFKPTGRMHISRDDHQAVLLPDGRVLVAGGWTAQGVTVTTELFDPRRGTFALGPSMRTPRAGFTAVAMSDGRVLLAGGQTAAHVDTETAEVFDPRTNTIQAVGDMTVPRSAHAATLLINGRVLVAGGTSRGVIIGSAEVFDPATARFTAVGPMQTARYKAGSVTLADGRALIVGGASDVEASHPFATTEIYDPATSTFSAGPLMTKGRYKLIDSVVRLGNGDVVVAGGAPSPEIYDAREQVFRSVAGTLGPTRLFLTATALDGESVLLVGGYDLRIQPTASAWVIE